MSGSYSANGFEATNIIIAAMNKASGGEPRGGPGSDRGDEGLQGRDRHDQLRRERRHDQPLDLDLRSQGRRLDLRGPDQVRRRRRPGGAPAAPPAAATTGTATAPIAGDTIKNRRGPAHLGRGCLRRRPHPQWRRTRHRPGQCRGRRHHRRQTYKLEMYALDDAVNGVHNPEQGAKNAQAFIADPAVWPWSAPSTPTSPAP